jgi:purine-nucleoside phosphorylase
MQALGDSWPSAEVAVVLGSGLGGGPLELTDRRQLDYAAVPGLGACTVPGHEGLLLAGNLEGCSLLVFRGRRHLYEGRTMEQVALPVRLAEQLGARLLLLFSAVGAIDPELEPGSWVFVDDHINLAGRNPLEGVGDASGPAFVDLTHTYRTDLYPVLAERAGPKLERGVLAMFPGPSYETPAEVRMAGLLGARVVGMSTVPEAVWARYLGLDVIALARVVNPAAGVADGPLRHAEVVKQGAIGAAQVPGLIAAAVAAWRSSSP